MSHGTGRSLAPALPDVVSNRFQAGSRSADEDDLGPNLRKSELDGGTDPGAGARDERRAPVHPA
jgi:hypothetical protein